jgi:peptidyl-prolyl cis-trans isomerase C
MATKVNASHILVKTEAEATQVLEILETGKTFEKIAQERSICPSGKKGGNLGWFTRGRMVKEFENAAFALKKGQVSGPVKTQFGYHIIKVVDAE